MGFWDDNQKKLEELAGSGLSSRDIAVALGLGQDGRNAVIGRCHRTGVKLLVPSGPDSTGAYKEKAVATRSSIIQARPFYNCRHPRTPDNTVILKTVNKNGTPKKRCKICYTCGYGKNKSAA